MSHKQAKRIRKLIRKTESNIHDRRWDTAPSNYREIETLELDDDGAQITRLFYYTGTMALLPYCGRAKYQRIKSAYKAEIQRGRRP